MPVLEHVFAAIFNFVAFPQIQYPTGTSPTFKHSENKCEKNEFRAKSRRSLSNTAGFGNNNHNIKGLKMEGFKRRKRVFSMSVPSTSSLMPGPPPPSPPMARTIQTPQPSHSAAQPQRDAHPPNLAPQPSTSTVPSNTASSSSATTPSTKKNSKGGRVEKSWVTWANDVDVVGSTSAENLTKLVVNGDSTLLPSIPTTSSSGITTRAQEKKKGIKRKRSNSSVASISSSFSPLSKKLSGLMARTPKKARIAGNGLNILAESAANHAKVPVPATVQGGVVNASMDLHAALRDGKCRLVGNSLDFDDLYADKPDDALLSIPSALRLLTGEQSQPPSVSIRRNHLTVETITYCLWVACHKSLTLFPYTNDKEEEEVAKEERECYALQLFMAELGMAVVELLPSHGVLHVPVDPRVSNSVVDTIHHTLYLVEAFGEVGADLHRLVFDIPATHAGIHAGQILSLEHNLHINFTLVCDLSQAAACLPARPYGISVPVRLMKNVGDERIRVNGIGSVNMIRGSHQTGGYTGGPTQMNTSLGTKAKPVMQVEQDIRDHPAFETIRSITRLVAIHASGVLVSARDVDFRRFLYALKGVHAVSLTQSCLIQQRWHAYFHEGRQSQGLYYDTTDAQRRRADDRAHAIKLPALSNQVEGEAGAPWETALRQEVDNSTARNPKVLRRYVDREWIGGSGLSKAVKDLAFSSSSGTHGPPDGFLGNLGGGGKRSVLMVMEGALEEECKVMGNLHRLVADYLEKRFSPLPLEGQRKSSRQSTAEA